MRHSYLVICTGLGLALGWIPAYIHGPIAEKYNVLYIQGAIAVWAWYTARMLIGFWIGISAWPRAWYLRGPLIGLLVLLPLTLVSLATPGCGAPCMALNLSTATTLGFVIAGVAYALTGKHHGGSEP